MRIEQLHEAWRARERTIPIQPVMSFEPAGLVLGAGTVLLPVIAKRRLRSLEGCEARILALLSVAYGKPIRASILSHIDRAAKSWRDGEDTLALIHLALAGLPKPADRREAARRLFIADTLMDAGGSPHSILKALDLDTAEIDEIQKAYSAAELRIPKGSGLGSGEWTAAQSVLADLSEDAGRFLGNLVRNNEVTFALGLLLIPEGESLQVEGSVPELPGLQYSWNRDEADLRLTYHGQFTTRVIHAQLGADGQFHDGDLVVARLLSNRTLAIDPATVSADLADKEGPNLCPVPVKDAPGRPGEAGERDKDYEDQIKRQVNPDDPTPRGYAYAFFNPKTGRWVKVDDCDHPTAARIEIKGRYNDLLSERWGQVSLTRDWLDQSQKYMDVSPNSPVAWVFAEREAAEFAQQLFRNAKDGQKRIMIFVDPPTGARQ